MNFAIINDLKISFILSRAQTPCEISTVKLEVSENQRNEYLAA